MDMNSELMLDGNALAGMMYELFGVEMTTAPIECAHCGTGNQMGALRLFNQAPGIVLRCPACEQVMVRIVRTPDALYVDARGAAYLRIARPS
jgi:Zn finger protein HypA/HybF involved in hydrogenase expression